MNCFKMLQKVIKLVTRGLTVTLFLHCVLQDCNLCICMFIIFSLLINTLLLIVSFQNDTIILKNKLYFFQNAIDN